MARLLAGADGRAAAAATPVLSTLGRFFPTAAAPPGRTRGRWPTWSAPSLGTVLAALPAAMARPDAWALILAGGDGTRLQPLTRRVAGDGRPKQFCPLFEGGETLLDRARHRARLVVPPERQVVVVARRHAPYYAGQLADLDPARLVVQPAGRGTAAGVVYPLLRIRRLAGDAPVVIMPSDHDVAEPDVLAAYLRAALAVVGAVKGRAVLLGVEPEYPEPDYGWIETEEGPLALEGEAAFAVRRFWEKPPLHVAEALLARGGLWNTLILAGRVGDVLGLVHAAAPELLAAFAPAVPVLGTDAERAAVEEAYERLPDLGLSEAVLARVPRRLLAVRAKGLGWSDWGDPRRVLASLRRTGRRPWWLDGLRDLCA